MDSNIVEIFSDNGGKFRLQYHKETNDLYINDKKMAYDLTLTWWQNLLAILVSFAVIVDCFFNVLTYFYKS